jgi:hypothetical protein
MNEESGIRNYELGMREAPRKSILSSLILILCFSFFILAPTAQAASTLYFSPAAGSYTVGDTFAVAVFVSSAEQAMNAASGIVSFSNQQLEVISLSKAGSIFTLWVQEPSFSQSAGTVNFEGVVLNPGFTGAAGRILTINFRARAPGRAAFGFSSGSILANDGAGTNILSGLGSASFSINAARPTPEPPPTIVGAPAAPLISSPTHPNPDRWYATNDATFTWPLPPDATAARLLVGRAPRAVPTVDHVPAIDTREVADLEDGTWYFHARLRNDVGWGAVSHFRFQIDTKKPSRFEIQEVERADRTDPRVRFVFAADDETSGVDHYEVRINNESPKIWRGGDVFETPALGPGRHTLVVRAVDRAGNYLAKLVEFSIDALTPPLITDYPKVLESGQPLIIRGTTKYKDAEITIWIRRENEEARSRVVRGDGEGNFTFVAEEELKDGIYRVWAEVVDNRGARSPSSEKVAISVEQPAFLKLGALAISLLAVFVPLLALLILLLGMVYYSWRKFVALRRRVRKEISEAERALEQAFALLKESIQEQTKMLEKTKSKRALTKEEERVIRRLNKKLDAAEKYVRKEVGDVEKETR